MTSFRVCCRWFLLLFSLVTTVNIWTPIAQASEHAVFLIYHRFGDDRYPTTNIKISQLNQQIEILKASGASVWPVAKILHHMQAGKPLPEQTIGITIDDAFASFYENGWPVFKKHKLPVTLFVSTDPVDKGDKDYMSWEQLRELRAQGLEIGNHGAAHGHYLRMSPTDVLRDIDKASQRFMEEMDILPSLLAYPYGEFDNDVLQTVSDMGFEFAFGQHSGVAHHEINYLALPRFAMNENYGNATRFQQIVAAQPLYMRLIKPNDTVLQDNKPVIQIELGYQLHAEQLNCYASNSLSPLPMKREGQALTLHLVTPFPTGMSRINCTAPGPNTSWYWAGFPFFVLQ